MRRVFNALVLLLVAANMLAKDAIIDGIKYFLDEQNRTASVTYNIPGPDVPNYNQLSGVVVIPATISYSGTYTVTSIGLSAFEKAPSITEVVLPSTITTIDDYAFHDCGELKKMDIPSSVTYLGNYAFRLCRKLTTVNIPAGIKKIGTYTFSYCEALKDLYIPATVDTIRTMAFSYCKMNNLYLMRPTPPVTEEMPCYSSGHEPKLIVPYGSLAAYQADVRWNDLEITTMPKPSFDGLYFDFDETAQTATLTYELKQKSINYIALPETVVLPATINKDNTYTLTAIGDFALAYNRSVESVTIPEGVTSLGNSAFEMCEKLSAVSMPEGIETIGSFCFNLCKQLQAVHLQEGLVSMGTLAFYQCENLTTVSLPSTLVTIEDNAFDGCTALSELTNYNPVPQDIAAKNVFNKLNVASVILRVPQGSLSAYQNAPVWQDFYIVEFDPQQGIDGINHKSEIINPKFIKDGQLLIERNGKTYNALGAEVQ